MKVTSLPRWAQCWGSLREAQKPQSLGQNVLTKGMKLGTNTTLTLGGNIEPKCFVFL
jgi:hypothetical protein